MEASKATADHIKQVASDPQLAKINLMRHQWTDLPPSKNKEKLSSQDHPVTSIILVNIKCHHIEESLILNKLIQVKKSVQNVVIPDMLKVPSVQQRNTSVSLVISMDIFAASVSRYKYFSSQEYPKHTSYKLKKCICKMSPYAVSQKIYL